MSVAIRAITRIQDADDVNVIPAVGVDEYTLTYDHDTAKFVLRAPASGGVTDHGALTGLTPDDDHTQYALLAGRAGGQTLYGGTAANDDITIHGTSDGTRTSSYVLLQPSGGNVGIGTTTALGALDVSGGAKPTLRIMRDYAGGGYGASLSSGWDAVVYDHFAIGVGSASDPISSEKVRITSGGNVGINDTAPAEALDVTGNINTTGVVKVDDIQVLSNRVIDARAADVANSGDATTDGLIDALRDAMIAHGLIAAA